MEEKDKKNIFVQLRLIKILETGFVMDTAIISGIQDFDVSKISIEFALKPDFDIETDVLGLHVQVKYRYPDTHGAKKILELDTFNQFSVKNLKDIIEVNDKEFNDKVGIMPTLLSISVSSLRGILVVKTAGTLLTNFPLPIVNPVDLCNRLCHSQK